MNIAVFCAGKESSEAHLSAARELGVAMSAAGHSLVWGSQNGGSMRVLADTCKAGGSRLIGIGLERLKETAYEGNDELITVADNVTRNALLMEKADAFIALPGGLGTLNEITDVIRAKKWMDKPVVVVNTNGFFDGLKVQLERMAAENFIEKKLNELVTFVDTPQQAIASIS